jgi:hypothetical protein
MSYVKKGRKVFDEQRICPICDTPFKAVHQRQIYDKKSCKYYANQKNNVNVISKKDFPEYYAIKDLITKHEAIQKIIDRQELTLLYLIHPIVRNRREMVMNTRKYYELRS